MGERERVREWACGRGVTGGRAKDEEREVAGQESNPAG